MIDCVVCGRENPDEAQVCIHCGSALSKSGILADGTLELHVGGEEGAVFRLRAPLVEGYIIGRTDRNSSYVPDVDLAAFNALERGVSRRHAVLVYYEGLVHVLDLNSANGTFLNGKRLAPEVPYLLNVGDRLRLGNLSLSIMHSE